MYDFEISKLKTLLKDLKISASDASVIAGVTQSTMYNYLNEKTPITVDVLVKLSNKLNFDILDVISPENHKRVLEDRLLIENKFNQESKTLEQRIELLEALVGKFLLEKIGKETLTIDH